MSNIIGTVLRAFANANLEQQVQMFLLALPDLTPEAVEYAMSRYKPEHILEKLGKL